VSEPSPGVDQARQGRSSKPGTPDERSPAAYGHYRRAPRYRAFALTGVVIGLVIGVVLAWSQPITGDYSRTTIVAYLAASLGLLGGLLGLGAAVLVERRRS